MKLEISNWTICHVFLNNIEIQHTKQKFLIEPNNLITCYIIINYLIDASRLSSHVKHLINCFINKVFSSRTDNHHTFTEDITIPTPDIYNVVWLFSRCGHLQFSGWSSEAMSSNAVLWMGTTLSSHWVLIRSIASEIPCIYIYNITKNR